MFITKSKKSPFYSLVFNIDGKRKTITTKTTDFLEACKFAINYDSEIVKVPENNDESITLIQFKNEYVEYLKSSKSINYIRSVGLSFKTLLQYSGNLSLNQINHRILDKFITEIFTKTPRACVVYYRTLKAAFS
jgi:hypothetical protein